MVFSGNSTPGTSRYWRLCGSREVAFLAINIAMLVGFPFFVERSSEHRWRYDTNTVHSN